MPQPNKKSLAGSTAPSLDDVLAGIDTVMTAPLVRLFSAAGCSPTTCHACEKNIRVGATFKLMPWRRRDEMLCAKCGRPELAKRDREQRELYRMSSEPKFFLPMRTGQGGFSRPSKKE